jgi:tropomyosin-1
MAAQIRQKLEILKKEKDEALEHVDRITSERKEQEERADCAEREVEDLRRKIILLEDDLRRSEERCEQYASKLSQTENDLEERIRVEASLRRQLEETENDLEIAEENYSKTKEELESTLAELGDI